MITTNQIIDYKDSFREGRRNDDIVNFVLAFVNEKGPFKSHSEAEEELSTAIDSLMHELQPAQKTDLEEWEIDYLEKFDTVLDYYWDEDSDTLESLVIELDYE